MTNTRIPRVAVDFTDRDDKRRLKASYLNAFNRLSVGQEVLAMDGNNARLVVIVKIDGDTIWLR